MYRAWAVVLEHRTMILQVMKMLESPILKDLHATTMLKNVMDRTNDLEKISFKEMSSKDFMRYHFPNREVAFVFYNWYGCLHGFSGRKSLVVRNINSQIIQQIFLFYREGTSDDRYTKFVSRKREHKPTSRCGCNVKLQVHLNHHNERWYIKYFDNVHNHSFLDDKYE